MPGFKWALYFIYKPASKLKYDDDNKNVHKFKLFPYFYSTLYHNHEFNDFETYSDLIVSDNSDEFRAWKNRSNVFVDDGIDNDNYENEEN